MYQTQEVPLAAIEDFATANIVNQQTRAPQNNRMAVKSLFDSLDEDMMKRMLADEMSYTMQNTAVAPLLFRLIISKSEKPRRGQVKVLKDQFTERPDKIKGMDIETFNDHVREINISLAAFGHQLSNDDLVQDLLAAYKHSDDHQFNEHFKKKEVKWLRSTLNSRSYFKMGKRNTPPESTTKSLYGGFFQLSNRRLSHYQARWTY